MELAWSPAAVDDLNAALDYIEYDLGNPAAARRLLESVLQKAELFSKIPGAGVTLRTLSGIDTGYRYLMSGNWMIFFRCEDSRALVVRILYARSDYMKAPSDSQGPLP